MSTASRFCGLALAVLIAAPSFGQDLDALNARAIEAFGAGDAATALSLSEEAAGVSGTVAQAQSGAYLLALNNLTFLLMGQGDFGRADDTSAQAVAFAQSNGIVGVGDWGTALLQRAQVLAQTGEDEAAMAMIDRLMPVARDTPAHGFVARAAGDLAFDLGRYPEMLAFYREMVGVTGDWASTPDIATFYDRQSEREAAGDIEAVSALIDTRILLVQTAQPQLADDFAHSALWTKFYMNYQAGNFGAAADALSEWASVGEMSDDDLSGLTEIAENILNLTRRGVHAERTAVQLGYAELAVALARIVYPADDPRIGVALRERADAESSLGLYARAAATLQEALAYPETGKSALGERTLLLEDLAANAWQRGETAQAQALYDQAAASYRADLAAGMAPFSALDRSVLAANRAKLSLDMGDVAAARSYLETARAQFDASQETPAQQQAAQRQNAKIAEVAAYVAAQAGGEAVRAVTDWVDAIRTAYPEVHADRAQDLHNAADQLMALGETRMALDLLAEADAIAAVALPDTAPLRAEIKFRQALAAIMAGDRAAALPFAARTVAIFEAPENRDELADNRATFDVYAWLQLTQDAPTDGQIDAALAAVQWTQVNRAAEAVDQMNARMVLDDPAQAGAIRRRQDAASALTRARSALTVAYATGDDPAPLLARQAKLATTLAKADADLAEAGLGLTGQAAITPLSVAGIQALLAPGEVLVTFLLPGLKPEVVPGVGDTSNRAIAISRDRVLIAPVTEDERGALVDKVAAFRCEMAISDAGCGRTTGLATLRGAMLSLETEAPPVAGPAFGWDVAHGLYADLFGGLSDILDGAEHLIIAPPGDLLNLPFSALVTAPGPHDLATAPWLVRSHAISVLPSIPALATLRRARPAPPLGFLGVGDPVVGAAQTIDCADITRTALRGGQVAGARVLGEETDGLRLADPAVLRRYARLPDTRCELSAMQAAFGQGRLILGREATETTVKALDADGTLGQYGIIAFATHGLIAGEAGAVAPGLLLTPPETPSVDDDGLLTSAEIATLDLNARLVILSACNTAAGEDATQEGLSGLAGSFFHAGAQALMVTHWAVFSEASARVGAGLASRLAGDPQLSNAEALRRTVLDLLDDPAPGIGRHPAYWAPFAIVGA